MKFRSLNAGVSRRRVLQGAGAIAAGAIAAPFVVRNAYAQDTEGEVFFGCNGGSTQTIFETIIIPKFTAETGIAVNYVALQPADSVAKLRAQRGTSGLDIVWLGGAVTYVAIDEGLLAPFDQSLVPNAANIGAELSHEPEILSVAVSGNSLIYNKDVFAKNGWAPPTSWLDLWDPRFAGHTGMYGMSSTGGIEMLFQVAKELTGDYTNLDPAFAKFAELSDTIYEFFPTAGAWETAFQQGSLWLAVNSYTRAIQLTKAGQPIGFVLPESGVPSHELPVGLVEGAANPKAAHAWANFLLSTEAQQMIASNLGYSPSVSGVAVDPELQAFYPKPGQAWFPNWREQSKRFDEIVERWQREVER